MEKKQEQGQGGEISLQQNNEYPIPVEQISESKDAAQVMKSDREDEDKVLIDTRNESQVNLDNCAKKITISVSRQDSQHSSKSTKSWADFSHENTVKKNFVCEVTGRPIIYKEEGETITKQSNFMSNPDTFRSCLRVIDKLDSVKMVPKINKSNSIAPIKRIINLTSPQKLSLKALISYKNEFGHAKTGHKRNTSFDFGAVSKPKTFIDTARPCDNSLPKL